MTRLPRLPPGPVLFLAAALTACSPPGASDGSTDRRADSLADVTAIRALHDADMAAVMAGDTEALLALWSSEPMALPPDGPILVGTDDIAEMVRPTGERDGRPWQPAEYVQDFREIQVIGDHAWDLGTVQTRMVHRDGRVLRLESRLLRILRRGPDGAWRVHRSAWSNGEPSITAPEG